MGEGRPAGRRRGHWFEPSIAHRLGGPGSAADFGIVREGRASLRPVGWFPRYLGTLYHSSGLGPEWRFHDREGSGVGPGTGLRLSM